MTYSTSSCLVTKLWIHEMYVCMYIIKYQILEVARVKNSAYMYVYVCVCVPSVINWKAYEGDEPFCFNKNALYVLLQLINPFCILFSFVFLISLKYCLIDSVKPV
jgi:hypothetical protein